MKNRTPWVPIKPKTARRCNGCNGKGKVSSDRFGLPTECNECGGKGFK